MFMKSENIVMSHPGQRIAKEVLKYPSIQNAGTIWQH